MPSPTRPPQRRRLLGTPIAALALAVGVGGVVTACQPAPTCAGLTATIVGTAGPDVIDGTTGADVIAGLGGDDKVFGLGGDDVICGGAGDDRIDAGPGRDQLDGQAGSDLLNGSDDADTLHDTSTDPRDVNDLVGAAGDDVLRGGGGRDRANYSDQTAAVRMVVQLSLGRAVGVGIDSLTGIDAVIGGAGDDLLSGSVGAEALDGRAGDDRFYAYAGDDTLIGGPGRDVVDYIESPRAVTADLATGQATGDGRDRLLGIEDVLGSGFDDVLTGDAGPNLIDGRFGTDTCRGGGGADTLVGCP